MRLILSESGAPKCVYESRVDWLKFEDLSNIDQLVINQMVCDREQFTGVRKVQEFERKEDYVFLGFFFEIQLAQL